MIFVVGKHHILIISHSFSAAFFTAAHLAIWAHPPLSLSGNYYDADHKMSTGCEAHGIILQ